MKRRRISKGKTVKFDDIDLPSFLLCKWYYNTNGYARGTINGKKVYFHRLILPPIDGLETDRINGNRLDNRRCNLRRVTRSDNNLNRKDYKRLRKQRIVGNMLTLKAKENKRSPLLYCKINPFQLVFRNKRLP